MAAALVTRCALDQGKYWEFSSRVFGGEFTLKYYQQLAQDLEMDVNVF